jgi:hypothetical protein
MSRAIDQRLRRLEATRHGPRVIVSAFPLPDDAGEKAQEIRRLLRTGEAVLSGYALCPAKTLSSEEWIEQCAPRHRELPT